jgi:hypothetical protein
MNFRIDHFYHGSSPNRLPIGHDLRTTDSVISMGYKPEILQKATPRENIQLNRPKKHIIHKAILWQKMLDDGEITSLSELARKEGFTRARITQIMNLLKLPAEMQEFLVGLDNWKEIRKYSERKLRKVQPDLLGELSDNPSLSNLILGGNNTSVVKV